MGLQSNVKAVERYAFDKIYMSDKVERSLSCGIEQLADNAIARSIPSRKLVKKLSTRTEMSVLTGSSATRVNSYPLLASKLSQDIQYREIGRSH